MSRRSILLSALALLAAATSAPATASTLVEEVPFITTPDHVTLAMLELAGVGAQDHVLDLGSGDGRIVITAAKRFGASGLGLEIVPDLVAQSDANAQRAGVADRARFRVQDIFEADLSTASVITMYLLPEFNLRLRPSLLALAPGTRIVSHDWDMGDWEPDRTITLPVPDKAVGREKLSRLHLWHVPAPVQGRWCAGALTLEMTQRFQSYRAQFEGGGQRYQWSGRVRGAALPPPVGGPLRPGLTWRDGALHVAAGAPGLPAGTRFASC
ncbi:methyltransferase domain-containing protein [Variovorax sp. KK3]|uniref:class I SAM-dependent methyltransferase n=1 Tax=Variovorax sp. KK3 TaxID=1855728 RepID=UPI00097CA293|nr:methyltransferase domain-containing protein [Variovorax sp. KK3]